MNEKIFYQVKGAFFRDIFKEDNLVEIDSIFRNENPIIARKQAFNHYQNYIDVFLESKGKKYQSHEQTISDIQDFVNSYNPKFLKVKNRTISKLETDWDKGIGIYLVSSTSKVNVTKEGETIYEDKRLIHYLDKNPIDYICDVFENLEYEYLIYNAEKYDCMDFKRTYKFINSIGIETTKSILETPVDFKEFLNKK